MVLHLIKLCVGCDSIADLSDWIDETMREKRRRHQKPEHVHVTRMVPKRSADLLDGGSLYWVIRGNVQVRQRLLDIRPFIGADGIGRCGLVLEPKVMPTEWQSKRAFQGWRYYRDDEAPDDLKRRRSGDLPPELKATLAELGLR